MALSAYELKEILLKIIIVTYFGYVLTYAIPPGNVIFQNAPLQFNFPPARPLQPTYYGPLTESYQHSIEPTGTFYDKKRGILRSFPGGGLPLLVDYQKRCSNNFVGTKPHPQNTQYYYVCKPDCVVFGKCQNLQAFDGYKGQCSSYPQPNYTPVCTKPGRFVIPTDSTIYYKCDANLMPQIFSCPRHTVFSPQEGKCIRDASLTMVSPYGSHIPQDSVGKFPPCVQDGTFRTPSDCSLYYTCAMQTNRVYLQTRYRCPELTFFDTTLGACRPQHEVACDAIQLSELVYPRRPAAVQYRRPPIYPPYYSFDSLQGGELPQGAPMSSYREKDSPSPEYIVGAADDYIVRTHSYAQNTTTAPTTTSDPILGASATTENPFSTTFSPEETTEFVSTDFPLNTTDIPKMEVVVFSDLDVSVVFCGNECSDQDMQKYGKNKPGNQHAVGVQWDPVQSNKTMSLVTVKPNI